MAEGGHVTYYSGAAGPARSAYLEQVRLIAPEELVGREVELARLSLFCGAAKASDSDYLWWQAPAWAGKSALLAWFVLHPPADVRVVSFFVTARYAAHSDRSAFLDVVLEQLAELAREPVPPSLSPTTREAWFLRMLEQAAQVCRADGRRLVLVVDGLDEDRGVTIGPDAHSIAALLPVRLPDGVRVVVAGRPNPPLPFDVPEDHPLRSRDAARRLTPSEHARVIRADAERELRQLLRGSPAERDLLGLVASAGGGLSDRDLAELSVGPAAEVRELLRAVFGRTFSRRVARWQPDDRPTVYLLAHEELQNDAVDALGDERVRVYRQRLHEWAQDYRDRGWPPETPEYLLRDYHRLLHALGDIPRVVACATDPARLDRLFETTGGDGEGFAEIAEARDVVLSRPEPDPSSLLRLAVIHERISRRGNGIPGGLPRVWATLGEVDHAEALARSIPSPNRQAWALLDVARVVATAGDAERAVRLAEQAKAQVAYDVESWRRDLVPEFVVVMSLAGDDAGAARTADSLAESDRSRARSAAVKALTAVGQIERARVMARALSHPYDRDDAILAVIKALADRGDAHAALMETRTAPMSTYKQGEGLLLVAEALIAEGEIDQARGLVHEARPAFVGAARPAWSPLTGFFNLEQQMRYAKALVAVGDLREGRELVDAAVLLVRSAVYERDQVRMRMLAVLARSLAEVGELAEARQLARDVVERMGAERYYEENVLEEAVRALAELGETDEALGVARSEHAKERPGVLIELAKVMAAAGDTSRARTTALSITAFPDKTTTFWQSEGLTQVADTLAAAGERAQARRFAAESEAIARSPVDDSRRREQTWSALARALALAGDLDRALTVAALLDGESGGEYVREREDVLSELAKARAVSGDLVGARELALSIHGDYFRAVTFVEVAKALGALGDTHQAYSFACQAAWTMAGRTARRRTQVNAEPDAIQASVLGGVAEAMVAAGAWEEAHEFARQAEDAAPSDIQAVLASGRPGADWSLRGLIRAWLALGEHGRVREAARQVQEVVRQERRCSSDWVRPFAELVAALSAIGERDWARGLAREVETWVRGTGYQVFPYEEEDLVELVRATATAGHIVLAEDMARSMTYCHQRAEALAAVALALPSDRGRRLLATALVEGEYDKLLPVVARIAPEAVIENADYIRRLQEE